MTRVWSRNWSIMRRLYRSWSICRGNHRCLVEIEGDMLPHRLAVHREELWCLSIGLFFNGKKKLTISWQSDLSILVYEHGARSPSLSTSMEKGSQRSPSSSTIMGQESPSLSTSMGQRFPFVSTSMENDLSCPFVFFLIYQIIYQI